MTAADRVSAAVAELVAAMTEQLRAELLTSRDSAPALVDVAEAARTLGISRTTMYASILDRPDGVRSLRVGARRLVSRADLDAFASSRT